MPESCVREILFRGKRADTGEWVYGNLIRYLNGQNAILELGGLRIFSIIPFTVGQFTGHTDRNGVKMFEGDIIDMTREEWDAAGPAGHNSPICAVEFDKFTGGFNPFANYDCDCGVYINAGGCEVIGNRWDNPELLEVKPEQRGG